MVDQTTLTDSIVANNCHISRFYWTNYPILNNPNVVTPVNEAFTIYYGAVITKGVNKVTFHNSHLNDAQPTIL